MKIIVNLSVLILIFSFPVKAQNFISISQKIIAIEHKLVQAETNGDVEFLDEILADDFLYIGSNGKKEDKAQWIGAFQNKDFDFGKIQLSELEVLAYDEIAILTGISDAKITYKGNDVGGLYRYMAVYEKQDGDWKLIRRQTSKMSGNL